MVRIGIIGKTNVGKTTFFNAATLLNAKISNYPFTTKTPNYGRAYVQTLCVCREFKIKDNPKNSTCIEGWRFIPVELIDLPGLIEGAYAGKGLGNQFLKVAMSSDVLLHVIDASGSIDEEGKIVEPGRGDPVKDYYQVENELIMWFKRFIEERKKRIEKVMDSRKVDFPEALRFVFSGTGIKLNTILEALKLSDLEDKKFSEWKDEDLKHFSSALRQRARPTLIVANKMDLPTASENYEKLIKEFGERFVVPCSADAELALRKAERAGMVKYIPGEETFKILDEQKLTDKQKKALSYVSNRVFGKWLRTGVQFAINFAVFKLLRMNVVYPVLEEKKLADSHGNVLPDAYLMPPDSTVRDLAEKIHSDLARHFIYAVDVRTNLRLPENYILRDRDVIKIVAARKK